MRPPENEKGPAARGESENVPAGGTEARYGVNPTSPTPPARPYRGIGPLPDELMDHARSALAAGLHPEVLVGKDVRRKEWTLPSRALGSLEAVEKEYMRLGPVRRKEESPLNLGVHTGAKWGGIVDVDDDIKKPGVASRASPAIIDLALRGIPHASFGRVSRPRCHRIVRVEGPTGNAREYGLPGLRVEARGDKHQTMWPPSVHPETGETIEWSTALDLASFTRSTWSAVCRAAGRAAFIAAIADRWRSREGMRHEAAKAFAGAVNEYGWSQAEARESMALICSVAGDEEAADRERAVDDTYTRTVEEKTGLPTLSGLLGFTEPEVEELRLCLEAAHEGVEDEEEATPGQAKRVLDPDDPVGIARRFKGEVVPTYLYCDAEGSMAYDGNSGLYVPQSDVALGVPLQPWLDASSRPGTRKPVAFKPKPRDQEAVLYSLKRLPDSFAGTAPPPTGWRAGMAPPDGIDSSWPVVPCQNGLLAFPPDGGEPRFVGFTPAYFTRSTLGAPWDPRGECPTWIRCVERDWWPDDSTARAALQEFMGYTLAPGNWLQLVLVLVGVGGCGKGTIIRLWRALLGGDAGSVTKSLFSFGDHFGLAGMPGKRAVFVTDATKGQRCDLPQCVERMKCISGEDAVPVREMHRVEYDYRIEGKIIVACTETPAFLDSSGSLAQRFRFLEMVRQFRGTADVDPRLEVKLVAELPGVLRYAADGLQRVLKTGRIDQPTSGAQEGARFRDDSDPHRRFGGTALNFSRDLMVSKDDLYLAWCRWCAREGASAGSKIGFVRKLNAAYRKGLRETSRDGTKFWEGAAFSEEGARLVIEARREAEEARKLARTAAAATSGEGRPEDDGESM